MPTRILLTVLMAAMSASATASAAATQPAASLAEPPEWPIGFAIPDAMGGKRPAKGPDRADILIWLPDGAKRIRAMLIIPNNSDSKAFGEHAATRKVAAKHEMAIVYLRNFATGFEHRKTPPESDAMAELMALVSRHTHINEFVHAPWVTFGKSSRGEFPFRMAWLYPDRTIASITYHGETPTWPIPDWARLNGQTILSVNANGESEWAGTWFGHVRPSLLNYRATQNWLSHIVVVKGVGHGDYIDTHGSSGWGKPVPPGAVSCLRVWDYLALFMDKAVGLRLPPGEYPTEGPLALRQVDEASGVLIDPFAVETLFKVPRLPLREKGGVFLVGEVEEKPVDGFAVIPPAANFAPPEGVPVVKYESGKSPRQWILTDSLKFAMQADPMLDLGHLQKLMPAVGDEVTIDGKTLKFAPIETKQVGPNGGIALNTGLRPPNGKITLLAYTVLEVDQPRFVRVRAGYTAATRIQLVLNGVPVRHKQVLELKPGLYPLLLVLRMTANWDRIEPDLEDAPAVAVAMAKAMQAELDARAAEEARLKNAPQPRIIHKAADVPPDQRKRMFWVADQELADAWLDLHKKR